MNQIGQIAIPVSDTGRSEEFYESALGLRKLYRYGALAFFDCGGVRLMLSPPEDGAPVIVSQGAIYFRVPDLLLAVKTLRDKGVAIEREPHLTAPMPDHDLWMAFILDP